MFDKKIDWINARIKHWVDEDYRMFWVYSNNMEVFNDTILERMNKKQQTMPPLSWTIASVATLPWARIVFPDASDFDAMQLLWNAIFDASRINENKTAENWQEHIRNLEEKMDILNALNFKYLHFKNNIGTDLKVELPHGHVWISCVGETTTGNKFIANIPTEEIFTAPLRTGVNGIVYATKPIIFMGEVIEGIWLRLKDGKVTDYFAKNNHHILEKLLFNYENSDYLGEVALVPHSSPISQTGILWYDTSFDENASCHLAFGYGYPQTLKGTRGKSKQEKMEMGLNQSSLHEDFMIGSEDMNIIGFTQDDKEIPVFKNGEWIL